MKMRMNFVRGAEIGSSRGDRCRHAEALPRWERVEEVGRLDCIARLFCPDCGAFLEGTRALSPRVLRQYGYSQPEPATGPATAQPQLVSTGRLQPARSS